MSGKLTASYHLCNFRILHLVIATHVDNRTMLRLELSHCSKNSFFKLLVHHTCDYFLAVFVILAMVCVRIRNRSVEFLILFEFINFLIERRNELAIMTGQHLYLVLISTGLAVLVGVPLGLVLTRRPVLARPVIGFASVMQTVPSLALFGFLIPLPLLGGIGNRTAIVALVLYALLPILRNTYTGVLSVDPAVVEAGRGLGMTDWQRLRLVEIPLALPVIITGIRISMVVTVGTAELAVLVGGKGLGTITFTGVFAREPLLIIQGAAPTAFLAVSLGFILERIESWITPRGLKIKTKIFEGG